MGYHRLPKIIIFWIWCPVEIIYGPVEIIYGGGGGGGVVIYFSEFKLQQNLIYKHEKSQVNSLYIPICLK